MHLDAADDVGGQHQVVEAAGRVELVQDEPVGRGEAVPVQQRAGEVRRGAAQAHAFALAEFLVDDDARDPRQGFGDVLVGELADILGRNHLDDSRRVALAIERLREARADASDNDFVERGLLGLHRARASIQGNGDGALSLVNSICKS